MALFTDGPLSTNSELQQYESGILNLASIENIDITSKGRLAHDQLATDLLLFLDRNSLWDPQLIVRRALGLNNVVVTEPLKRWHVYKTLAMVYEDAYNNQLNDRYQGKWAQYDRLAVGAAQALFHVGIGVVHHAVPKAGTPALSVVPMSVTGTSYFVSVSWVNLSGQEGLLSDVAQASCGDGSAVMVAVTPQPEINLWNVYAGSAPDTVTLQSISPLAVTATWTIPATGLRQGPLPGCGQQPEWWIIDRHIMPRG